MFRDGTAGYRLRLAHLGAVFFTTAYFRKPEGKTEPLAAAVPIRECERTEYLIV